MADTVTSKPAVDVPADNAAVTPKPAPNKPGPKPKPAAGTPPPMDMAAAQAAQKLLHDTYPMGKKAPVMAASKDADPKTARVWVAMRDYTVATRASGPIRVRAGMEITSAPIISALKAAGADIRPVR